MITIKLNLTALKHGLVKGKTEGETLLCIPIKVNSLFLSEKGNVYFDIVAFDYKDNSDKQYKDTHLLKQSFSKEVLAAMDEDQKKALPIIGHARVSDFTQRSEAEPNNVAPGTISDGVDSLPF